MRKHDVFKGLTHRVIVNSSSALLFLVNQVKLIELVRTCCVC